MISLFSKPCSHFSLMSLSPNFCSTSIYCSSILYSCFSGSTMMGEYSAWQQIPPPTKFGWPLGSCLLFHHVYHISKMGPTALLLKWHSSNLCLTLNLMFSEQIPPRHYLPCLGRFIIHLASIDPSWTEINLNKPRLF